MPDYTLSAKATFDGSNFNSGVSKSASALDKFKSKCDSVSSKTSGSFGKIVKAATGITTALAGIGTGLILKGGIDRALNIEQAQYKLKQMGMNVQEVMNSVNAAAKGTKFGLGSVATVASSLGASGVEAGEQMTNALKTITGMATLSGRSVEDIGLIFGKVAAQGKIQGDELMQFSESGLNVTKALAEHLGVAQSEISELAKKGQIDFQTFADAMQKAYGEAAYGANDTFIGSLENVKSALSRLGEKFAKPALEGLKGVFQNTIPAVDALTASLDPAANKFGEFATNIGERVSSGLQKFVEVLNQTQSPLQAFKAAISETFGAEWGGAINAFVDAFSSVGSVIKDAIQWFVSLDSGAQVAIAQFVAFAAAARPIVSILASVGSKVASFAQGMSTVGSFLSRVGSQGVVAATGMNRFTSSVKTTATGIAAMASGAGNMGTKMNYLAKVANSSAVGFRQTGAAAQISSSQIKAAGAAAQTSSRMMTLATNAANLLKGALASIGIAAAFAGAAYVIGKFADQFASASKAADNYKKATEGLRTASDGIARGFENAGNAAQGFGEKAANAGRTAGEAIEASADMADRLTEKFSNLGMDEALVARYSETIKRLAGNTAGSAQKQGELAAAVEGLNGILGTTYEIVDKENGVLNTNTDEILNNVNAWRQRAEAQAYMEAANEHVKEGIKLQEDIDKAAKNTSDAYQRYMEARGTAAESELKREYDGYKDAEQAVRDLKDEHDQLAESYYQKAGAAQQSAEQETAAIDSIKQALSGLGEESQLSSLADSFGLDLDTMSQKLMEFGVTANDIANMTPQSFEKMASAMGTSVGELAQKFTDAGLELPPAVNSMVQSVDQANSAFSQLGEGADFSAFAKNLGVGMDEAASTLTQKCGELTEVSEQTVRDMSLAFQKTPDEIMNALSTAGVEVPQAVRDMFQGAPEAAAEAGTQTGQEFGDKTNEGAAQGATDGGETVVQGLLDTAQGHEAEFQSIGLSLGNSLSTGFAQADMMSTQTALTNLFLSLSTRTAELMAIGTSWGNALSTGFAMADMMSTQTSITMLIANLSMRSVELMAIGVSWGNALSTGFATADMMSTAGAVTMFIANLSARSAELTAIGVSWGNALSTGFSTADMMSSGAAIQSFIGSLAGYEGQFNSQGVSYGNALSTGFASADMASAAAAISSLVSMISGHEGEFTAAGNAAGMAYASGFSSSNIAGAASVVSSLLGAVNGMAGSFMAAGIMAGNSYTSGFSSANTGGAVQMVQNVLSQIQGMVSQFTQAGTDAGNGYANGITAAGGNVSAAAAAYGGLVSGALSSVAGSAFSYGSHVGSQFAAGISSQAGAVASAAASLAAAAKANIGHSKPKEGPLRMGEEIFGRHLDENFARGIEKNVFLVERASEVLAQGVYDRIGDKPAKGPLTKGGEYFGTELDNNFAKGIEDGRDTVEKASESIAQTVYDYVGHTNPAKGPLSCGEWVFGVHAATNFAAGLGSAEAIDAVTSAAEALADAAAEAWTRKLLAAYQVRSGEFKEMVSGLADFMESAAAPFFAAGTWANTRGNGANLVGIHDAVYDSLYDIKKAGYDLESFRKQDLAYQKELAEKTRDYERKLRDHNEKIADIEEQAAEAYEQENANAAKIEKQRERSLRSEMESWEDYIEGLKEWRSEYQSFMSVKSGLATQDFLWLKENEKLFEFEYEINVNDKASQKALKDLADLSAKTGVVFSKSFVEKIMDGSEEADTLLHNLAQASADDVKQMTLAFEDMQTQQRMVEQSSRELWVNSMQQQKDATRTMRDLFLDYKDTVLDVKEALYSNAGLSNAFKMAGVSAEGFALDLQSIDMTMKDFTSNFENFTTKVSNGFQVMDSYKQTGLSDWTKNLKQNMAESQAYAKNLQKVMDAIPDSIDSEAFRKAIAKGGFDQWGHVIADLAAGGADKVKEAVELYNQSITEGQQSIIEQFRALAPGEEYANAFMESFTQAAQSAGGDFEKALGAMTENLGPILAASLQGAGGEIESTLAGVMQNANAAMQATSGQWSATGSTLAQSTAQGITAQTGALVSAATSAVQAAVSAAQAAAAAGMAKIRSQLSSIKAETSSAIKEAQKQIDSAKKATSSAGSARTIGIESALPELPNIVSLNTRSTSDARGISSSTTNTYGDVHIQANVRNDADIRKLARELKSVWNAEGKARGLQ